MSKKVYLFHSRSSCTLCRLERKWKNMPEELAWYFVFVFVLLVSKSSFALQKTPHEVVIPMQTYFFSYNNLEAIDGELMKFYQSHYKLSCDGVQDIELFINSENDSKQLNVMRLHTFYTNWIFIFHWSDHIKDDFVGSIQILRSQSVSSTFRY